MRFPPNQPFYQSYPSRFPSQPLSLLYKKDVCEALFFLVLLRIIVTMRGFLRRGCPVLLVLIRVLPCIRSELIWKCSRKIQHPTPSPVWHHHSNDGAKIHVFGQHVTQRKNHREQMGLQYNIHVVCRLKKRRAFRLAASVDGMLVFRIM